MVSVLRRQSRLRARSGGTCAPPQTQQWTLGETDEHRQSRGTAFRAAASWSLRITKSPEASRIRPLCRRRWGCHRRNCLGSARGGPLDPAALDAEIQWPSTRRPARQSRRTASDALPPPALARRMGEPVRRARFLAASESSPQEPDVKASECGAPGKIPSDVPSRATATRCQRWEVR